MVVHHWSDDGMVRYHRRSLYKPKNIFWQRGPLPFHIATSIIQSTAHIGGRSNKARTTFFQERDLSCWTQDMVLCALAAILLGVITTHLCQSNESNRFFISTQFWLFYCNLQIQTGHIWLLWGILVVIFPAEWFILCSKVSAAAGETFSWWLCSCRLPQAAIASSFFKPRALLPPRSTHLLEQFHAIKVPHHAHCTSTPIPISFFKKLNRLFLGVNSEKMETVLPFFVVEEFWKGK